MAMNLKVRVIGTVGIACVICTGAAIIVSAQRIAANAEAGLAEKSRAILSRLEVGRDYVAEMDTLKGVISETVKKYPDGELPDQQKAKILKSVPVFAAFRLGSVGAEKEGYEFRVFSDQPRDPKHLATEEEKVLIQRFAAEPALQEIVEKSADGKYLLVTRPVRLAESQGCLSCHGHPNTSPWGNGKDILGFQMEDMKDGELRGGFTVISKMEPVEQITKASIYNIMAWGGLLTAIALLLAYFLIGAIVRRLQHLSEEMRGTGDQVASASQQISATSESLSATSTESASSLAQTVASLEELSSIVNRNAETAKTAAHAAETCLHAATKGENEIRSLVEAMNQISESSKRIEDITNVIDDLAFQTNLLSLNAAVEAARAGEQGRGFAVVADAVRGLAQKSAVAAQQVNGLIRESVDKVKLGAKLANNSGTALSEIVSSVQTVSEQNSDIAAASVEQSQGIAQISQAMGQLDSASQENARSSEQAANSSKQLALQSESLRELVVDLKAIIEGEKANPEVGAENSADHTRFSAKTSKKGA